MDQEFFINFQFQVSKTKFRYLKTQLNYFRITRAQLFCFQFFQCEAPEMEEKPELPPSEDIFKYVPDVRDLDEPVEDIEEKVEVHSEVIQEIAQVHHQDPEETLTISDSLAKNHFPELLEQTQNVFEVYEQGEVIEQWYTVQPEKAASNVEVLEKLENEVDNEEDKADIKKLLAWAKSSKKKKTNTMVIRSQCLKNHQKCRI